jgi:hypothetical protein
MWHTTIAFPLSVQRCEPRSSKRSDRRPPHVPIDSGMLEGAHFGAAPDEVMFLGIPFAAPPTGEFAAACSDPEAAENAVEKNKY